METVDLVEHWKKLDKEKSASLQEHESHAGSFTNLELGNSTTKSVQLRPRQTNTADGTDYHIMNFEYANSLIAWKASSKMGF